MNKDFHNKPFDEPTQLKLEVFRNYLREWLPVFLTNPNNNRYFKRVAIFDFFAGPGCDVNGNPGSPIIIIDEIQNYLNSYADIANRNVEFLLVFNDLEPQKIEQLKARIGEKEKLPPQFRIQFCIGKFEDCYNKYKNIIHLEDTACLAWIDQFGVKEMSDNKFLKFRNAPATDILFFFASSFIKRFSKQEECQKHINIPSEDVANTQVSQIHRLVCSHFQKIAGEEYFMAPFSIKKGNNIYGLVFGTSKMFGLFKFLEATWKIDKINGEANMDIYNDEPDQYKIFPEENTPTKTRTFEQELKEYLFQKRDNCQLIEFALLHGFLPKHLKEVLTRLDDKGLLEIQFLGQDKLRKHTYYTSYDVYKKKEIKLYIRLKNG